MILNRNKIYHRGKWIFIIFGKYKVQCVMESNSWKHYLIFPIGLFAYILILICFIITGEDIEIRTNNNY